MSATREKLVERINLLEKKIQESNSLGVNDDDLKTQLKVAHEQLAVVNQALNENASVLKG
jgi:hypothetical protein